MKGIDKMSKFTQIPQDTFSTLQTDVGVVLKNFDPDNGTFEDADIVTATTGGITASCVPTYSDMGEDIDNCPNGMLELQNLDSWECRFGFTALSAKEETIRLSLGAADIQNGKITPRDVLKTTDFSDLWWVGDRKDGGMLAICLKNALSTGGFSLTTTKNGKGQMAFDLKGHYSIKAQNTVPMDFYVSAGTATTQSGDGGEEIPTETTEE